MASKKEIFEVTVAQAEGLCKEHKVNEKFSAALMALLTLNLEPKNGGASVNIEDVTKSVEGKITEIQCSVSGVFLPATKEYFYEDKNGKGINGLKRLSRQAESARKTFIKTQSASKNAIMSDVLDGKLKAEVAKDKLTKLAALKPDFSKVGIIVPVAPTEEK